MVIKKYVKNILIILISFLVIFTFFINFQKEEQTTITDQKIENEDVVYNSNIIENVNYITKDNDGNEYIINAIQGEIDYSNSNIIYLTTVRAKIKLKNSENIIISSDFGKYNSNNFDTIFSKNVIINYLDNEIKGEYLDFSIQRNSMIISKNLVYKNLENILKADVIEIDIKTKDAKIYMYESEKQVNMKNRN